MWVVILQNDTDVRPIYIGKSKKKAERIAKQEEDIEHCNYCYVRYYKEKESE